MEFTLYGSSVVLALECKPTRGGTRRSPNGFVTNRRIYLEDCQVRGRDVTENSHFSKTATRSLEFWRWRMLYPVFRRSRESRTVRARKFTS